MNVFYGCAQPSDIGARKVYPMKFTPKSQELNYQKKKNLMILNKFIVFCQATFIAILGC